MINPTLSYKSIELSHMFITSPEALLKEDVINKIIEFKNMEELFNLVLFYISEKINNSHLIEIVLPLLYKTLDELNINNFVIFLNTCQYNYTTFKDCPNVFFIDYWAGKTYVKSYKSQTVNDEWNINTSKGLFLTGKPKKLNRVGLLFEFWKNREILDNLDHSFFYNPIIYEELKEFLLDIPDEDDYKRFLSEVIKSPDNTHWIPDHKDYYGNPESLLFDYKIYSNTSFSIVSETDFTKNVSDIDYDCKYPPSPVVLITEKTWKPIINRHAFILAGTSDLLNKVKSLGFRTFEEYLTIPNYHSIENDKERIISIVKNVQDFIKLMKEDHNTIKERIKLDVNFNYFHYLNYIDSQYKQIEEILITKDRSLIDLLLYTPK